MTLLSSFIFFTYSCINNTELSKEIHNLRVFAKLYGYVRFFHPSDEASRINWQKFAIYGAEKVKNVKTNQELKVVLQKLFKPIAPTIQILYSHDEPHTFDSNPPDNTDNLHFATWQHKGVRLRAWNDLYKSVRLGRFKIPKRAQEEIWLEFNKVNFRGKKFKLTARVKVDVSEKNSSGYLYIYARDSDRKNFTRDYMRDYPIKNNEWKEYSITGKFEHEIEYMEIGAELVGVGSMFIDDFQFLIYENDEWKDVSLGNPDFEKMEPDSSPSSWNYHDENMYEYKVISDGDNRVLQIKSKDWYTIPGMLFGKHAQVGEVFGKPLGDSLACQVPLALWSDSSGTLGKKNKYSIEPLLSQLEKIEIDSVSGNEESVRLADVIIAWNVFQHFYPYFDVIDTDWDNVLSESLQDALHDSNEFDFKNTLKKMIAELDDGHGNVLLYRNPKEQARFPFRFDLIEDEYIITFSKDTTNFKRGDIILKANGKDIKQVMLEEKALLSGSLQWKKHYTPEYYCYDAKGSKVNFLIKRNENILEIQAERNSSDNLYRYDYRGSKIENLENNIYYVDLDRTSMPEINAVVDDLAQAKGVIFDLRVYPKGNHAILSHLTDVPIISARWNVPQIIYPDQENIAGYDTGGRLRLQPKLPKIRGKVVFLTKGRAISSAETLLGIVEHYKLGEIIGEASAGTNGTMNRMVLPGKYWIFWTGMKVLKHDGSQHHLVGIQPTAKIERTIQGVREGKDEYIEKAIELINQ
jgi:C-terminal processing protease CtpA/Prc